MYSCTPLMFSVLSGLNSHLSYLHTGYSWRADHVFPTRRSPMRALHSIFSQKAETFTNSPPKGDRYYTVLHSRRHFITSHTHTQLSHCSCPYKH